MRGAFLNRRRFRAFVSCPVADTGTTRNEESRLLAFPSGHGSKTNHDASRRERLRISERAAGENARLNFGFGLSVGFRSRSLHLGHPRAAAAAAAAPPAAPSLSPAVQPRAQPDGDDAQRRVRHPRGVVTRRPRDARVVRPLAAAAAAARVGLVRAPREHGAQQVPADRGGQSHEPSIRAEVLRAEELHHQRRHRPEQSAEAPPDDEHADEQPDRRVGAVRHDAQKELPERHPGDARRGERDPTDATLTVLAAREPIAELPGREPSERVGAREELQGRSIRANVGVELKGVSWS
eukprot:31139-Pelagococcus_subviridis.AAC.5